jgi:hypothetical protein
VLIIAKDRRYSNATREEDMPVPVDNWNKHPGRRVLVRFPLPYKIEESTCRGNADKKLRCEAATFIWIGDHCPDVPIPYLWGFGSVA